MAAVTALVVAVVVPNSSAEAQQRDPAAVVDAYESARDRGEMDAVIALFADDAVVVDSAGVSHRGRRQIRLLLQPGANPDWSVVVSGRTINGDYVFWTERVGVRGTARSLSVAAIVRDGAIKALAYGGRDVPLADTPSGDSAHSYSGLAGVLLAILGSFGIVAMASSHPGDTALTGSLLPHLRQWSEGRAHRQL